MKEDFKKTFEQLVEKNIPVAFLDYDVLRIVINLITGKESFGRKEILTIAYLIGASSAESNLLLEQCGHKPLYVKRREDAIWTYSLDHHMNSASIIEEIFPQNADEKKNQF